MKINEEITEKGRQAARDGKPMTDNPYLPGGLIFPSHFTLWLAGWCEVERSKPRINLRKWVLQFLRAKKKS